MKKNNEDNVYKVFKILLDAWMNDLPVKILWKSHSIPTFCNIVNMSCLYCTISQYSRGGAFKSTTKVPYELIDFVLI